VAALGESELGFGALAAAVLVLALLTVPGYLLAGRAV